MIKISRPISRGASSGREPSATHHHALLLDSDGKLIPRSDPFKNRKKLVANGLPVLPEIYRANTNSKTLQLVV